MNPHFKPEMRPARLRSLTSLAASLLIAAIGQATEPDSNSAKSTAIIDPLQLAREAYWKTKNEFRSGTGTGTFELYVRKAGGKDLELVIKANAAVSFSGDKYLVKLAFETDKRHHSQSRVILCDGTTLATSQRSRNIHPLGGEGHLLRRQPADTTARDVGFSFDPSRLFDAVVNLEKFEKVTGKSMQADAEHQGKLTREAKRSANLLPYWCETATGIRYEVDLDREARFRVCAWRCLLKARTFVHRDCRCTWKQAQGVWYVQSVTAETSMFNGSHEKSVLRYDQFQPQAEVPAQRFHLASLDLPPGARIIDLRKDGRPPIYSYRPNKETEDASIRGIGAQVETLPTR